MEEQLAYSRGGSPSRSEGLSEVTAGYASVPVSQTDKQNDNRITFIEPSSACELGDRYCSCRMKKKKIQFYEKKKNKLGSSSHNCCLGVTIQIHSFFCRIFFF